MYIHMIEDLCIAHRIYRGYGLWRAWIFGLDARFRTCAQDCKQACRGHAGCKGIEYSAGRCEVWTREGGIEATVPLQGFKCYG